MSVPNNPVYAPVKESDLPPLDEHLKSIEHAKTRMAKVYDFLLGEIADNFNPIDRIKPGPISYADALRLLTAVQTTSAYPELPNRKRLVELIEKAMPKEVKDGV